MSHRFKTDSISSNGVTLKITVPRSISQDFYRWVAIHREKERLWNIWGEHMVLENLSRHPERFKTTTFNRPTLRGFPSNKGILASIIKRLKTEPHEIIVADTSIDVWSDLQTVAKIFNIPPMDYCRICFGYYSFLLRKYHPEAVEPEPIEKREPQPSAEIIPFHPHRLKRRLV